MTQPDVDPVAALRQERDDLARRLTASQDEVARLTTELESARAQVRALETQDGDSLSLFEGEPTAGDRLTGDGSDPRVLSMVLGATAIVAGMVALLTLINGKLGTPFGVAMVVIAIGLGWAAARTRVVPVEVSVVRGIVYIEQGESTHRFDVRKPSTRVEMVGSPGDPGWVVRFPRKGMDPFVIDGSMVDAEEFVRQLREHRPDL
ncbi:PspA/IM30 family protein [Nocardioides sp. BYT-33-1]|uniref:PspA/IM30 family protein n=1 Tax=Nocardioides sp. BYT-33-1 TaxID=3416952 RepID=UPI003F5298C7